MPGILRQVMSNPVKLGLAVTPSSINEHTSSANLAVTSLIVSPLHRFIQLISGPCQMTQLDEILSHPFVVLLEFVGIINILFTIM